VLPTLWLELGGTTVKLVGGCRDRGLGWGLGWGLGLLAELLHHSRGSVCGRGCRAGGAGFDDGVREAGAGVAQGCVAAQFDRRSGAGVDGAGVHAGQDRLADDVGDKEEDDLIFLDGLVAPGEEVFEKGQFADTGGAVDVKGVLLGDETGEQAGLAVFELNDLLGDVLGDDRLSNLRDGDVSLMGGDLDLQLEGDLVVVVDGRGHADLDTDIDVGELSLDADAGHAGGDACIVGAGGDRNPLADLEVRGLAVGSTDAGILQDAGVGVAEKRVERAAAKTNGEVVGVEMGERVEGEVGGRGCGATRGWRAAGGCRRVRVGLRGKADGGRKGDS
jgi:hypothetical protein